MSKKLIPRRIRTRKFQGGSIITKTPFFLNPNSAGQTPPMGPDYNGYGAAAYRESVKPPSYEYDSPSGPKQQIPQYQHNYHVDYNTPRGPLPGLPGGRPWGRPLTSLTPYGINTKEITAPVMPSITGGDLITPASTITPGDIKRQGIHVSDDNLMVDEVEKARANKEKAAADAREAANKAQAAASEEKAKIEKIQKMNGVAVDGIWGPKSQAAFEKVKALQEKLIAAGHNIKADGVMGPKTQKAKLEYEQKQLEAKKEAIDSDLKKFDSTSYSRTELEQIDAGIEQAATMANRNK